MKRTVIVLVSVLAIAAVCLSFLSRQGEYTAEKLLYRALKMSKKIFDNPDVVPPTMFASVEEAHKLVFEKYPKTFAANRARWALIQFYAANKKFDKAITLLDAIIGLYEGNKIVISEARFSKGKIYEIQNQWQRASEEYSSLWNEYKDTPVGLAIPLYLGNYHAQKGNDAEAEKFFNDAASTYREMAGAYKGRVRGYRTSKLLVQAYVGLKKFQEAGEVVSDIIDQYPQTLVYAEQIPVIEAIFVHTLKNPAKAAEVYRKIKANTKNSELAKVLEKRIKVLEEKK